MKKFHRRAALCISSWLLASILPAYADDASPARRTVPWQVAAPVDSLAQARAAQSPDGMSIKELLEQGSEKASQGFLEEAAKLYQEVLRRDPQNVAAHNNLAMVLKRQGLLDQAIAEYHKAIAANPMRAELYNNLGCAYIAKGDFDKALNSLYTALQYRKNYASANYNVAHVLCQRGDYAGAISAYEEAIKQQPTAALYHRDLGDALRATGGADQALAEYRLAQKFGEDNNVTRIRIARCLKDLGRYDESQALVNDILAHEKQNTEALDLQGLNFWKLGDSPSAMHSFEAALDIDPCFVQARNNLGAVLYDQHRFEEAVAVWRQALTVKSDCAEVHYNLGTAMYQAGLYKQAADAFRQCLQLTPNDAMAHNNLGLALLKQGETDGAIGEWRKAIELEANLAQAHINLGKALMHERKTPALDIHESG